MKNILRKCLILALILICSAVSVCAIPNNPTGTVVPEVPTGDVMDCNYGTVTDNYGTINHNYGTVINNYGAVTNESSGTVTNNQGVITNELPKVVTDPESKNRSYNGSSGELVTAGVAENGTMEYAIGSNATTAPTTGWGDSIPCEKNAGLYYVWYKCKGESTETTAQCVMVVISPAALSVESPIAQDKYFDGTQDAVVTMGKVKGIYGSDDVKVTAMADFADANVGSDKMVNVQYSLSGTDAANYMAPSPDVCLASILASELKISGSRTARVGNKSSFTASICGNRPEGSKLIWKISGGKYEIADIDETSGKITVIGKKNGLLKLTATLVDESGKILLNESGEPLTETVLVNITPQLKTFVSILNSLINSICKNICKWFR